MIKVSILFSTVKSTVTARQAADLYGLHITPSGLALCPFHHDKTPSMKVDTRYYCFACGETGDAIDLTARLLNLSPKDAALRLAADFNINVPDECPGHFSIPENRHPPPKSDPEQELRLWKNSAVDALIHYSRLLREWEQSYAPQGYEEEWHPRFCQALRDKTIVEYLLDELMFCSDDRLEKIKLCCEKEIQNIERRMGKHPRKNPGGNAAAERDAAEKSEEGNRSEHGKCGEGSEKRSAVP